MAKITIVGDAIVITSTKTLKDIETLAKYRPKALCLYDADGKEELFRVAVAKGEGSINRYGASFSGETHDEAKLATITLTIPSGTEDVMKYAMDKIGTAIISLNKVEEQFSAAMAEVAADEAAVRACITMA